MSFYPYLEYAESWKISINILNCIVQVLPTKANRTKPLIHIKTQNVEVITSVYKNQITISEHQPINHQVQLFDNNNEYNSSNSLEINILATPINPKPKGVVTIYTPGVIDLELKNSSAIIKTPVRNVNIISNFGSKYSIIDAENLEYNMGSNSQLHLINATNCKIKGTQTDNAKVLLKGTCTFGIMTGLKPVYVTNNFKLDTEMKQNTQPTLANYNSDYKQSIIESLDRILDGTFESTIEPIEATEPKLLVSNFPPDPFA